MQEYTYYDFLNTLNNLGQYVTETIHKHITENHPEYKSYGILPKDKTKKVWSLYFRKHPKHGKPLCSLFSSSGLLSVQFIFYSTMANEVLLRQDEFGDKVQTGILRACECKECGYFGDKEFCWCQHHYYISNKLKYSCNSAWYTIDNITESDIQDLLYLADLQSKHMSHGAKESRGSAYEEDNLMRCGNISIVKLNRTELNIDDFKSTDYTDVKRFDKYAKTYNFTLMGTNGGLWCYFDDKAVCGTPNDGYVFTTIPESNYAMIKISNPFTFSAVRAWDYICLEIRKNNINVTSIDIGGIETHKLIKFYKQGTNYYMEMYVPVKESEM